MVSMGRMGFSPQRVHCPQEGANGETGKTASGSGSFLSEGDTGKSAAAEGFLKQPGWKGLSPSGIKGVKRSSDTRVSNVGSATKKVVYC